MDEVCDIKGCPMYGYFTNMSKHPVNAELEARINKKVKTTEDLIQSMSYSIIMLANNIRMRTLCSSCCYFEKIDMSKILISEEAKNALSKK